MPDEIVFYHFNDVYHVNQLNILSRFAYDFKQKGRNAITVFSGDAFGPSLESSILKGEHIIPVLNHLDIDIACYGNHDFDFGEDRLDELSALCNFPFLLSNAFHPSGKLLASAKEYLIREHLGYRIGFFGLAGTDWPSNCQHLPPGTIIGDPVEVASRISQILKNDERVDLVVGVTHMRLEEDILVSEGCPLVDLILGGHDHDIVVQGDKVTLVNNDAMGRIRIVKSGTDFRSYSVVRVPIQRTGGDTTELGTIQVHIERDISQTPHHSEDPKITQLIDSVQAHIASISSKPLFYAGCPLDGRGAIIRTSETNLGNLLADVVRAYYDTDIAFVNSGSIRCDRVIREGVLTMRDVVDILPFGNIFVVKRISTQTLLRALENSVSDSRTDGRFLQISGMEMEVGFRRDEGMRVGRVVVGGKTILPYSSSPPSSSATFSSSSSSTSTPASTSAPASNNAPNNANQEQEHFTVAMVNFIADGFDGYTCFTEADVETVVGEEGAMTDTGIMLEILEEPLENEMKGEEKGVDFEYTSNNISRARKKVFVGFTGESGLNGVGVGNLGGLPIVKPRVEGRINVVT
ncbi:hypothetical protein GYMLUDRAFT_35601 [Collybiopsis luxurians FD-317 M1]|nr:hypothetical protein GYMLUDRAFT_35601 [Collybiopsis luxurians FD-317 M1]